MKGSSFLQKHNRSRYEAPSSANFGDQVRIQRMQQMVDGSRTILDVGCWDGLVSQALVKRGCRVLGLDNSTKAVELAKQRGLEAQVAELDELWPVDAGSVDAVLAGEVIEHVIDIDTFLDEARRVLRSDGLLVVSTPNLAALGRRLILLLGFNPHIEISFTSGAAGHVRYFTPSLFVQFIESHGFKLEQITSDVVNFNASGSWRSTCLAQVFPSIGRCLIGRFRKTEAS